MVRELYLSFVAEARECAFQHTPLQVNVLAAALPEHSPPATLKNLQFLFYPLHPALILQLTLVFLLCLLLQTQVLVSN